MTTLALPHYAYLAIRTLHLWEDDHDRPDEMKEPHGEGVFQ
jgi:hypothetical protein